MAKFQYRFALACGRLIAASVVLSSNWCNPASADTLYKCVDGSGHVAYQQRPCDGGSGAQINTKSSTPPSTSGQTVPIPRVPQSSVPSATSATSPTPAPPASTEQSAIKLPPTPPAEARGHLDGWPASGDGLIVGMSGKAVVKSWGRPHDINVVNRDSVFFHYCDLRTAYIYKGELVSWSALFPDSKKGAALYRYGDPWIRAAQKWGYQRERNSFNNSATDRGDVQRWSPTKWVVTDAQGNIVSWCDTTDYPPVIPPLNKTEWE